MLAPRKVDGRWGSPPEASEKDKQHRQSKGRDSKKEKDTHKDKRESSKPKSRSASKGTSRRSTMTQKSTEHCGKDGAEKKKDKQPEKSRKEAVYDAKMNLLFNDFFVMLDSSPLPEEVFSPNSQEHKSAWQWLNKLTNMKCNTVDDGRIRNAYMSALSVCLNQKRLHGVFAQVPPEELEWMDFADTSNHGATVQETAANCAVQVTSKMLQQFASMGGPQRSFDPFRGMQQRLIEHSVELGRPQYFGAQQGELMDSAQRFVEEPQLFIEEESQEYQQQEEEYQQEQPEQSTYDPSVFPAPPQAGEQLGPYYKPSQVQFETFGSPPRFIAGNVDGQEFAPSGETFEDLGNAFKEAPPSSALPKRSILKRPQGNAASPKGAVSFNEDPYFDDELWTKNPIHSYRMELARRSSPDYRVQSKPSKYNTGPREDDDEDGSEDIPVEQAIKGSMQEEHRLRKSSQKKPLSRESKQQQQKELGRRESSPKAKHNTKHWTPETSEEEYDAKDSDEVGKPDPQRDMIFLMDCIRRELRGETAEGANDYMESEVASYRIFASKYRSNSPEYQKQMNKGDPVAERTYLLLNMQEDLTKLLSNEEKKKLRA
ncbi:uncharacterized protein LOC117893059 [Drosophila subobscura]|uniref:uncharacterized protein LOC117893059 n=1 Tax=Drosophila subobscura TaxID=7241 RepID=UPI00155B317F|nr:uncharacterized protein LOC117893059 [Drosophila subobscura]